MWINITLVKTSNGTNRYSKNLGTTFFKNFEIELSKNKEYDNKLQTLTQH